MFGVREREGRSIYRQPIVSGYANVNRSEEGKVKIESDKALRCGGVVEVRMRMQANPSGNV